MKKSILFLFIIFTVLNSSYSSNSSVSSEIYNSFRYPSLINLTENKIQEVTSGFSFQNFSNEVQYQMTFFTANLCFQNDDNYRQTGKLNMKTGDVNDTYTKFSNSYSVFTADNACYFCSKNYVLIKRSVTAISCKNDFDNIVVEI